MGNAGNMGDYPRAATGLLLEKRGEATPSSQNVREEPRQNSFTQESPGTGAGSP
jgi:hypothetical protein